MPWGSALVLGLCGAVAQVTVETIFEHEQYLANEPVRVGVRITNFSGQTLKLGTDPGWLDLLIESETGKLISHDEEPPIIEAFEIPSSGRATRWVDLIPYFDIGQPGRYKITPTVRVPELGLEKEGKPGSIHVSAGAKIWEQDFGIRTPAADGSSALEVRRYALIQSMNQKKITYYVRVSDTQESRVFRVFPIGPALGFSRPEAQVDSQGQLQVLFQSSARQFTYCAVSPDGELIARQTHQYTNTRPTLRAKDDGTVVVYGGLRLMGSSDIPKPEKAPEPTVPDVAKPAAAPEAKSEPPGK